MHCFKDYKPELTIKTAYNFRVYNSLVFSNAGAEGMFSMLRCARVVRDSHKDGAHPLIEESDEYELLLASPYSPYAAQAIIE